MITAMQSFRSWAARKRSEAERKLTGMVEGARKYARRSNDRNLAIYILAKAGTTRSGRMTLALFYRYGFLALCILVLASIAAFCWLLWRYDALTSLLTRNWKDTEHANEYYAVNVLSLPIQTLLLLLASVVGAWTLRQNRKFKQHDVEAACVRDYVAIEKRLEDADSAVKMEGAVRAYWTLQVYEYNWWRRGLISRELFTIWSEFRVQRFGLNPDFPSKAGQTARFEKYRDGFEFCKTTKVFQSNSTFEKLMDYLISRADKQRKNLRWHNIERFRHGWRQPF
jgi:hypothetical protein